MHTAFFEVGYMHNEEPTRGIVVIDAVTVIVGSTIWVAVFFR